MYNSMSILTHTLDQWPPEEYSGACCIPENCWVEGTILSKTGYALEVIQFNDKTYQDNIIGFIEE